MRRLARAVRRRAAVAGHTRDAGLTLAETVVSMAVGALLLALVTAFTVRQLRTIDYAEERNTATTQLATAQDTISQQVRTMLAFPSVSPLQDPSGKPVNGPFAATAETVGFYSYVTGTAMTGTSQPPVQENWFWVRTSGGQRQLCTQTRARSVTAGKLSAASPDLSVEGNRTCRVLVRGLAATRADRPLFRYVTEVYDPLSGPPASGVLVTSPATDSSALRALYVDLRVDAGTGTRPGTLEKATLVQLLNKTGGNS